MICALWDRPDGALRRRGLVTLLMKIIRPIKFENKVSVNRRRVARRVIGAGASGIALDDRVRVGSVEISDRIAAGAGIVDDAVGCRQEAVVRPAPHDVAEIDQKGPGEDRRGKPFARRQADRKPGHLGSCERSHEAVVDMRRLTERIVFKGILRRIVQKTQIGVGFVGEIRREVIGDRPSAMAKGGSIRWHIARNASK